MESLFMFLKKEYKAIYKIKESTWYNGHAYLPLIEYSLSFFGDGHCLIDFKYEHRQSEFSSSTKIDGGTFGDRHLYEVHATYKESKLPKFKAFMRGWFSLIFNIGEKFRIKCSDKSFKDCLKKSPELKRVFTIGAEDAEFDPLIKGSEKNVDIYFNTKRGNVELVKSLFDFLIKINKTQG